MKQYIYIYISHTGLSRRSAQDRTVYLRAGRPPTAIETSKYPAQQSEIDSITAATGIDTSEFFSVRSTPDEPIYQTRRIH